MSAIDHEFNGEYNPKLPGDFKIPTKNIPTPESETSPTNSQNDHDQYISPLKVVDALLHTEDRKESSQESQARNVTKIGEPNIVKRKKCSTLTPQESVVQEKPKTMTIICGRSASYPNDLNELIQPLVCNVCNARFTSIKIAVSHYESKNHVKKVTAWLTDWTRKTGEPMPKIPKLIKDGVTGPEAYHCKACDLPLTSLMHANQHYNGKKHKMVVANIANPSGSGYYDSNGKWIRTQTKIKTDSRYGIGESFRVSTEQDNPKPEKKEPINPMKHCNICDIEVSSESQMETHLRGSKHAKKLKQLEKPPYVPPTDTILFSLNCPLKDDVSMYRTPTGNYYCKTCDFSLQDPSQMKQHLTSKRHTKMSKC